MPIYEYRCPEGHQFEVLQSMTDDPVTTCEVCSKPVERVFHPIAVHFKGSGFYTTDYARKGSDKSASEGAAKDAKPSDATSKAESSSTSSGSGADSGGSSST